MTANTRHGTRAVLLGTWLPLALGVAGTALGQETPPRRLPPIPSAGALAEASTLSVEFQGGTIEEYVLVLSKAAPNLNVVIRPETKEIPMPPVSLKGVGYGTALQLIPALAASEEEIAVTPVLGSPGSGSEVFVIGVQAARGGAVGMANPGMPMGRMPSRPMRGGPITLIDANAAAEKSVRVFSLRSLTSDQGGLKPETVLTAIDTALGLQGAKEAASIKLHAESGLLVVYGAPAQIDVVEQVLTTMERDIRSKAAAEQQALQNENVNLKMTVESLKARLAELEVRLPKTEIR